MILQYVLFQTKKMLFASIIANGRPTGWASQFVPPLVPFVSVRHLSQISGNQDFNTFLKRWKKKIFLFLWPPFKYLSRKWRLQLVPIFEFICRHILLRFDILPISARYFRKGFGRWFTTWPCVTYKDDMWGYTGRLAGFGWMQTKTQWSQNSNLKWKNNWIYPCSSTFVGLTHCKY